MKNKPQISYTLNVENLKSAMINIHLDYLHNIQMSMIEEALQKSDWKESKVVIKHIMEKK